MNSDLVAAKAQDLQGEGCCPLLHAALGLYSNIKKFIVKGEHGGRCLVCSECRLQTINTGVTGGGGGMFITSGRGPVSCMLRSFILLCLPTRR